jgi:hypothetical protein
VELDAVLLVHRLRHECRVIDISQGGAKIRTGATLKVDDQVTLEVEWLGKILGNVRWVLDDTTGIAFRDPLPYRTLASWISGQSR